MRRVIAALAALISSTGLPRSSAHAPASRRRYRSNHESRAPHRRERCSTAARSAAHGSRPQARTARLCPPRTPPAAPRHSPTGWREVAVPNFFDADGSFSRQRRLEARPNAREIARIGKIQWSKDAVDHRDGNLEPHLPSGKTPFVHVRAEHEIRIDRVARIAQPRARMPKLISSMPGVTRCQELSPVARHQRLEAADRLRRLTVSRPR